MTEGLLKKLHSMAYELDSSETELYDYDNQLDSILEKFKELQSNDNDDQLILGIFEHFIYELKNLII